MPRIPRFVWYGALAVGALLGVALLALVLLLDPTAHKARVEEVASRALGMEVSVGERLGLRWRPGAHLILENVRARKDGADILLAREAVVGVRVWSLLGGRPQVHSVALRDGVFNIVRQPDGRFNFQKERVAGTPRPERHGPDVSFAGATITYTDPRLDNRVEARACRGDVARYHHAGGDAPFLAGVSFSAQLACAQVRVGAAVVADLTLSGNARQGVIDLQPITTRVADVQGVSRVHADFTGAAPAYRIEHTLRRFPVEHLLKGLSMKEVASGRMDLVADLAMQGRVVKELQQSTRGKVSLRGQGLTYHGADLDEQFARFASTQTFNLFDVGALFLVGPAGLLVTKGYDYAAMAQDSRGKSEIRTLVSDWSVERGIARAEDVALSTAANRVALKGAIDLANDRFHDMTIALVDAKGCAKVQQRVSGTLQKPVVDKPNPIQALAGPAVALLKKGAEMVGADSCEAFYAGSVAAPKVSQ